MGRIEEEGSGGERRRGKMRSGEGSPRDEGEAGPPLLVQEQTVVIEGGGRERRCRRESDLLGRWRRDPEDAQRPRRRVAVVEVSHWRFEGLLGADG